MTRTLFVLLSATLIAGSSAMADDPLLATLREEHPSLLLDAAGLAALKATAEEDGDETETDESADGSSEDVSDEHEPLLEDRIGFEEFQELDLRVAEVLDAEGIDGADKLAKLTVDIGVEERQIVAGIKQLHDLDELPGKKVVVVANLEKAELFGVESNGMVLAAGEQADLLTTHGDAEPGTRVR